jgi:hypothetical protein
VFTKKKLYALSGVAILLCAIYVIGFVMLSNSEVWLYSKEKLASSAEVQLKYGNRLSSDLSFFGWSYSYKGGISRATLTAKIIGNGSSGLARMKLHASNDSEWIMDSLVLE